LLTITGKTEGHYNEENALFHKTIFVFNFMRNLNDKNAFD
jgi:hypothetical protein